MTIAKPPAKVSYGKAGRARWPWDWRWDRFGRASDPAEPWERVTRNLDAAWIPVRPFMPTEIAQLPATSLETLERACGPLPLERLFVIPCSPRLVSARRCVMTPTEVLAFGDDTVALWIDDGTAGRVIAIPAGELVAIDDRQVLLYGRLRLIAAGAELVVRYNTAERRAVGANLGALRRRISSAVADGLRVPSSFVWLTGDPGPHDAQHLPYKWRLLLATALLRPDPAESPCVAAGAVRETWARHSGPASGVALLSSSELLIATEPIAGTHDARHGVDLLAVPRTRLAHLAWDGRMLEVHTACAETGGSRSIDLRIDPYLAEAMRQSFGEAVRWN